MNTLVNISEEKRIEDMIYEIRGKEVMLDSDLAKLYGCKNGTKSINLAVKRHINRFPENFMFKLTDQEYQNLWFQNETTNISNKTRVNPRVFTEEGVAMLATILKTHIAEETSVKIMKAFVAMRHYIGDNLIEQKYINNQVLKNTEDIKLLQESFNKLEEKKKENEIYYNGQIFDAYYKIKEIFSECKKELIIIDSYADINLLNIIKDLKVKITLITTNKVLKELDVEKYNEQYDNLKVIYDNTFHDRYFILDKKTYYHCGTSLNRIGYKTFSITKVNDKEINNSLLDKVNEIIGTY